MIRPQASKPGSGSRFRASFRRQKPSFLENYRTTLSGPQHLPIAKNEEAKRHDRGTLSQNEAFVACAGFTSQQCLYPVEIHEIGKELQLAGLELCRETFNCKDTPPLRRQSTRQLAERTPTLCRNDRPEPSRRQIDNTKIRSHSTSMGNRIRWASMDWSRRTFPAVRRRITIRWKLDLILLNPPNHTSSIPAAGVNFATSL